MRNILIFCVLLFLSSFPLSKIFAQTNTIVEGNTTSYSSSTTTIEGSGSVSTHIESSVNDITKILNSNTPGTYTLENSSANNVDLSITPTPTHSPTITSFITPKPLPSIYRPFQTFFTSVRNFFKYFFR